MAKVKKSGMGSLSGLNASDKRVGPIDPNGAYTKVQEATLAGARMTPKLKKDKEHKERNRNIKEKPTDEEKVTKGRKTERGN